jgi:hypothetical protein
MCYDTAMKKEVKLPKYESWGNYGIWLAGRQLAPAARWRRLESSTFRDR